MEAEAVSNAVQGDPRIAYAIVFGSRARESAHAQSDLDVALGLEEGASLPTAGLGRIVADIERDSGRTVDLVVIDGLPPALAYRIFRDGKTVVERNHRRLAEDKARAILEYLDFQPVETLCARGVLAALARGR